MQRGIERHPAVLGSRPSQSSSSDAKDRAARTLELLGRVSVQPGPLIRVLNAPSDDPEQVAAAIEGSPALAGRLLSVTNSAGIGLSRHIDCIRRAVIHLGASRARTIALAYGLRIVSEEAGLPSEVQRQLWVSSLRKAAAARLVAQVLDPKAADAAYAAALLQDIGLPMLMAVDPVFYHHEILPGVERGSWSDQERVRFGLDHAQIGARLLEEWNASSRLCDAVLDHHRPPLEEEDALHRIPGFLASLLPHNTESATPPEQEWMLTLHAQFLAQQYPTPDHFIRAAWQAAAQIADNGQPKLEGTHVKQIVQALSFDAETMVNQLCRLEQSLGKQKEVLSHLRFQAFTDQLTRVLNRRGFEQLAQRRLGVAAERGLGICVMVLDLDDFKPVNDQFGHEAGDLVLRGLGKLLRRNLDRSDLIGRLGGDEFVVLLTGVGEAKTKKVIQRISAACKATRIRINAADSVPLRLSIGATFTKATDDTQVADLIATADEAMYQRKRNGKSGACFAPYAVDAGDAAAPPGES
jgi:diguanylate cyclase (GGDEF)-like protein